MTVWAIADLHLSFGVPGKNMDVFGSHWQNHPQKIAENWQKLVQKDDLVLICGDISWGMKLEEARPDLEWIDSLPGIKILIKGNHDYWWSSNSKVQKILPPSCHILQSGTYKLDNISIGGTRLWDAPKLSFAEYIQYQNSAVVKNKPQNQLESDKIYQRELSRLENSLKLLDQSCRWKIAMTHYPTIGPNGEETEASLLLKKYNVTHSLFGHLHNVNPDKQIFGQFEGIKFQLVACDYKSLFEPLQII